MAFSSDVGNKPLKTRSREGLQLRPLNVEKGTNRYSSADENFPPQTATWRNNLIALSQRRNLLFVAYNHQIYVWQPAGSYQTLGSKPEMIITPVMRDPNAEGYISPSTPHAINNILVDDLGREEVLLLVTDSGNVCGYRVEAVYSALKRAAESTESRPLDGAQVEPFFAEYVEASAWGLAIHKFARLIAVTANTGLVTVFAFALVDSTSDKSSESDCDLEEEDDLSDYGQTWLHIKSGEQLAQLRHLMPYKHRTRNIKLTYTGHFANIPSVAFLNCDLDPNGMWMVSTDIDNKLLVWKIWESLGPFNVYHFNDVSFKSFPESLRPEERGWAVLALDPRSFHLLKSPEEACGGPPQRRVKNGQPVYDLTRLNSKIPKASQIYNYFPPAPKVEPESPLLPDIFGPDCRISKPGDVFNNCINVGSRGTPRRNQSRESNAELGRFDVTSTAIRPLDSADASSHQAVDGSVFEDNASQNSMSDTEMSAGPLDNQGQEIDGAPLPSGQAPLTTPEFLQFALLEALGGDAPGAEYSDDDMDDYSESEDDWQGERYYTALDDTEADEASLMGGRYQVSDPPMTSNFPILHFSQTDIRLIPHPFATHAKVVCGEPLRQPFTHPIVSIRSCDRFNMIKYIQEHGIVVAASQKGRAAIIALTESEITGQSFRVDWIVPFEHQEKYGDRPLIPLLGMAVGPVQGFETPPDVPYIPRDVRNNDLTFRYKYSNLNMSPNEQPDPTSVVERRGSAAQSATCNSTFTARPSRHTQSTRNRPATDQHDARHSTLRARDVHSAYEDCTPSSTSTIPRVSIQTTSIANRESSKASFTTPFTLPECHALATRAYHPEESWRGWNPSRRYRLMLMYADHTVMSYEFWYSWDTAGENSEMGEDDEDDVLFV
ncbi:uncharacterized protein BO97DRAFT_408410 [Aspergillus homomorphus CBS 101889]|uniref:Pyridine nucleotide-disulfide oxidoreductase family protein n=1 Tax=Aspergillus homomorphus (strain CBS 101889) TaxID=1450537 RepID=A0A395HNB4_ASPHC|nr:hypothetical protein BO97DRAFT_408410 [Aspergillus homomorphus CBS 101889]RAL08328.1 hypothetical protein BO97DRAFT_408410 [Aspergillus homomorphus CBS 101889]